MIDCNAGGRITIQNPPTKVLRHKRMVGGKVNWGSKSLNVVDRDKAKNPILRHSAKAPAAVGATGQLVRVT